MKAQSLRWPFALLFLFGWPFLLHHTFEKVADEGSYFWDIATELSYLVSWACLLGSLLLVNREASRLLRIPRSVYVGAVFLAIFPELILAAPYAFGIIAERGLPSSYSGLVLAADVLQTPGRLLATPLSGSFSRWTRGLIDPSLSYTVRHLVILNLSNIFAWLGIAFASVHIGALLRPDADAHRTRGDS